MKLAAPGIERIHVCLPAFAFRLLAFHGLQCASQAVRQPVEIDPVLPAEALAAALARERKMLAAGMSAIGALDGGVEGGCAVGTSGGHSISILNPIQ